MYASNTVHTVYKVLCTYCTYPITHRSISNGTLMRTHKNSKRNADFSFCKCDNKNNIK